MVILKNMPFSINFLQKEEQNMRRKLLTLAIFISLLCSTNITVQATTNSVTSENDLIQAQQCIDDFFYAYEDVKNEYNASEAMEIINTLASNEIQSKVVLANTKDKQSLENKSYLNTVQYMLQRREYIEKVSDIDETEYNKKLDITITDFNKQNNCLEVIVDVLKTWNYSFSQDVESAARDTYKVSLILENGKYVIRNITGFGDSIFDEELKACNDQISQTTKERMMNELKSNFTLELEERKEGIQLEQQDANEKATSGTYDGGKASNYALDHALNYNPNYANFNGSGGDCTNFISQCLKAGGISQHVGTAYSGNCWYYKTSTNRSSTWTGANEFRLYVTGSSSKINMPTSSWGSVTYGDIIQLMNGSTAAHSLIVSGVVYGSSGRSDILICCHTSDKRHASLNTYFAGSTKKYYHVKGNK